MSTTYHASMGDRGRLVIPAGLREGQQWKQGTPLLLIESAHGVVVTTRDQAKELVRSQLAGADPVESLIAERRAAAAAEEAA